MKSLRKLLTLALALVLLLSLSVPVFAAGDDAFAAIEQMIDDFSLGDTIRSITSATGFKDSFHVISADGSPVTLNMGFVSEKIGKLLLASKKYSVSYQWYSCDCDAKGTKAVKGATGDKLTTSAFAEPGFQYYFCRIIVSRSLGLVKLPVKIFYSPLYVVGYTGLPVVYVDTPNGEYVTSADEWLSDAEVSILDPAGVNSLDAKTAGIKGRGNTTWTGTSKAGYTIKFDKKQNLFGLGKDKKWALVGNFSDRSLLRNRLAGELAGVVYGGDEWTLTHVPVELVLNGEYRGQFTLATTVKLGSSRVDVPDISEPIEKDANKDGVLDYYDAGFVLEIDDRLGEAYYFYTDHTGTPMTLSDPDLDDPADTNEAIFAHIQGIVRTAEDALYSDSFTDPETGYAKYFDVDSFVDWYLLEEIAKNVDARFNLSTFIYYQPKDGKLHMASPWDFDIAFGNTQNEQSYAVEGFGCQRGWYARFLQDPAFAAKVAERWDEVRGSVFSTVSAVQSQADKIALSARMNFAKWPELGLTIWPTTPGYWMRWTYQSEVDFLIDWTNQRLAWLDSEGIPSLRSFAEQSALTAAAAELPAPEAEAFEELVIEEPIIEEPIIEEPVIEEPIVEEPIVEESIVEEPAA